MLGPDKAFGLDFREFRETKQISQERLALEAGLDRTFVSMIERGIRSPTVRSVVQLTATLEVRPSQILARMEQMLDEARAAPAKRR